MSPYIQNKKRALKKGLSANFYLNPFYFVNATTGGKMLCLGPQVVALIIFTRAFLLMKPIYEMQSLPHTIASNVCFGLKSNSQWLFE